MGVGKHLNFKGTKVVDYFILVQSYLMIHFDVRGNPLLISGKKNFPGSG